MQDLVNIRAVLAKVTLDVDVRKAAELNIDNLINGRTPDSEVCADHAHQLTLCLDFLSPVALPMRSLSQFFRHWLRREWWLAMTWDETGGDGVDWGRKV